MFVASNGVGWLEAVILGLIQGLTEFLPISSSAHLRILGPMLPSGLDPGSAFTAITQLGTELAVLVYFRQDIARIFLAWCGSFKRNAARGAPRSAPMNPDARLGWLVIVGTLPIAALGLLFQDMIETYLRNLYLTAIMLIVFGLILGFADKVGKRQTELRDMTWRNGIVFGFAQALALIPGVSRSGGTITAGLLMGYTREAAARYSFLLAVPAVFASGFYQLYKSWGVAGPVSPANTALATFIAFFVGYAVIVWFLKIVSTRGYGLFVLYRVALGVVVLALLAAGVLQPL
ncbi:MAG: undecaprenyl-diphosphate phosphatase [Gammaproteobacteria bacterium]|nr:undecaprenyl-diphosphate phosphatase [Gammaproteobacteria bacterium]MBU0848398.1 undecaprenyl-diphosphate phosphatase [Gammaproteobacteria bacterium]MBU1268199.1 undecaprenyl-diphosphate phosphatase [Gammaproteobacteria bacterium]MBU1529231.1 undecaprenyl-diphosphate phosphatase [Gammaproteobacteria bacterium]MBU1780393.1 undecaprenyl-diphosphate phosphatase [Gammaproteobacteria bacterium]